MTFGVGEGGQRGKRQFNPNEDANGGKCFIIL